MSDDRERGAWPPDYADPIVLRLRFVPRARREKFFPTQVASRAACAGYVSEADAVREALRWIDSAPQFGLQGPGRYAATRAEAARQNAAGVEPDRRTEAVQLAASTRNPDYAARMLGIDRNRFGDMLHNLKDHYGLRPSDNVTFEDDGSIYFNGDYLGNIFDHGD